MRFRRVFSVLLFITLLYGYRDGYPKTGELRYFISNFENVLGTSFEMKVAAQSEDVADKAEEIALSEIDRLSSILSGYDPSSEFSRWQRTQGFPVRVSRELFEVLNLFDQWNQRTGGGLNASAQAISLLWKVAVKRQQMPSQQALDEVVHQSRQIHWALDPVNRTATHLSAVPLMTNTFVKSYILRSAAGKVRELAGVESVRINIGGDIIVLGEMTEGISISNPLADSENDLPLTSIIVSNKAIATSGSYRRGFQIGDQWFSHIVDPRTGMPAAEVISATVVAENATDAGALATALNVLKPAEGMRLAESFAGVQYLIVTSDGKQLTSKGWDALKAAQSASTLLPQSDAGLTIHLELSKFEGRFRRPFVAVWIENNKKETVRTLALWYNKPRWLPDLKSWYHKNYDLYNSPELSMASISSATRPPGAYDLKWDMKDDKGNPLPPGKYTVYIEAAREHGTYQLIKKEIDCRNKSQVIQLPGNTEIASASLEYKGK